MTWESSANSFRLPSTRQGYMQNMIDTRRNEETKEERHDLLSNLLEASDTEGEGEAKLSDSELMGERKLLTRW